ncbi:MAG: hypothetical protein ACYC1C_04265 [Chloroflexota bacterium]
MDETLVVGITIRDMQEWVCRGVRALHLEDRREIPVAVGPGGGEPRELEPEMQLALVELPAKYGRRLMEGHTPLALVDEIRTVSLTTRDLTSQWSARMANLGEGWLPFLFQEGWTCCRAAVGDITPASEVSSTEPPQSKRRGRGSKEKAETGVEEGQQPPPAAAKPVRPKKPSGAKRQRPGADAAQEAVKLPIEMMGTPAIEEDKKGTRKQHRKSVKEAAEQ